MSYMAGENIFLILNSIDKIDFVNVEMTVTVIKSICIIISAGKHYNFKSRFLKTFILKVLNMNKTAI